jgi:hypothetical protein
MSHQMPAFAGKGLPNMNIQDLQHIPVEVHGMFSSIIGALITGIMTRKTDETKLEFFACVVCGAGLGICLTPAICLYFNLQMTWEYVVAIGLLTGFSAMYIARAMHKALESYTLSNIATAVINKIADYLGVKPSDPPSRGNT